MLKYSIPTTQSATALPTTTLSDTTTIESYPAQLTVSHVIVIILQNKNESYVLGNGDAPYINQVLIPNYSIAENYYAVAHPSLPNYIAITSGSTLGVRKNEGFTERLQYTNIIDLFSEHNITWKAYMESMPANQDGSCNSELGDTNYTYGYFTFQDPFVYYINIMNNTARCNQIVPLAQFGVDLARNQLPEFSFISPNILDDGHTASPAPQNTTICAPSGTAMQCADNWLSGFLPQVTNNPVFSNTIIFVTWDESIRGSQTSNSFPNNKVLLIAVSPDSKKGFADNATLYTHYSLLATIEKIYNLGNLGRNDTTANVINDLFVNNTV